MPRGGATEGSRGAILINITAKLMLIFFNNN